MLSFVRRLKYRTEKERKFNIVQKNYNAHSSIIFPVHTNATKFIHIHRMRQKGNPSQVYLPSLWASQLMRIMKKTILYKKRQARKKMVIERVAIIGCRACD